MERIIIREQDLTVDNPDELLTDIVYVPGFSTNDALTPFTPTLCRSLQEFNSLVGSQAPVFESDQFYPGSASGASINGMGFKNVAIPETGGESPENGQLWFSAGTVDPSYLIAKELVSAGLPVLYEKVNGGLSTTSLNSEEYYYTISVIDMYRAFIERIFTLDAIQEGLYRSNLLTKDYDYKYLTSGGYPLFEFGNENNSYTALASVMASIATTRGDCFALLDHTDNPARVLIGQNSVFDSVNSITLPQTNNEDTFVAMFTPYASYSLSSNYANDEWSLDNEGAVVTTNNVLPGSFAYLISLAKSIKTNPNWLSISGVTRGLVPNLQSLHVDNLLSNAIADLYQPESTDSSGNRVCINAITRIGNYGYCIWGNRTMQAQSTSRVGFATRFLNLRNLLCDVKKTARDAAMALMFEPNNDVLWANFKAKITPLLESMKSGSGISGYKILRTQEEDRIKLHATIRIYPVYAVEAFEIGIILTDSEVTVE